ncbi:MAG TPA: DNA repair protein RecN [Nocardioides sp.]|uniref:DNA repair protein RecN n=1 Tax=Nocardioides sp. TaxID=35761 RepID=UPI002E328B25|nr:DNA repair protein RecN [Nocardioides sp.]HEX3932791.1 DNA repair protein RecN [Nocardioides sp.]
MLEELRITGLGVIDSATLELGPGLTVITGETGAGKTMVVTALGLLLGGRADSGAVRAGSRSARVEGSLSVSELPHVAEAVEAAGGEVEDAHVLIARNVSAEGRSRAYVGGASVPVSRLAEVTEPLVAVHGQSDQHRLLMPRAQREALDAYGGAATTALVNAYQALYAELRDTERELSEVTASARERAREADLLRFGLAEIEAVAPQAGEDLSLAEEEQRLGHADALRTAAGSAREALSSDEGSPDALAAVSAARVLLESVRDHDPAAGELSDRIAEITYLLSDVAADVASYADGLDADPTRLASVSERRAALTTLTRKYGETAAEVLAWAEASASRLAELDDTDDRIGRLGERRDDLVARLAPAAEALSSRRADLAETLSVQLRGELASLAMPQARLEVAVRRTPADDGLMVTGERVRFGPTGVDEVELLLAANTGAELRPLAKGASGGELSRVMLALEVALAGTVSVPTFVFDEVDSGVGGKAAVEVGRRLAALAATAQVLVVTHLPQVAAYADRHVVVEKASDGSVTTSGLTVLDAAGRERELSRMFAGMAESETALAHARELLEAAGHG